MEGIYIESEEISILCVCVYVCYHFDRSISFVKYSRKISLISQWMYDDNWEELRMMLEFDLDLF